MIIAVKFRLRNYCVHFFPEKKDFSLKVSEVLDMTAWPEWAYDCNHAYDDFHTHLFAHIPFQMIFCVMHGFNV